MISAAPVRFRNRLLAPLVVTTLTAVMVGLGSTAQAAEPTRDYLLSVSGTDLRSAESVVRGAGASVSESFRHVGVLLIHGSERSAAALDRAPGLTVDPDVEITLSRTQSPAPSWGLDRIDQRALPLSGTAVGSTEHAGQGVWSYIVDSGILSAHQEFTGRMMAGMTRIHDGRGTEDCNGHGTHVAGTVAGATFGVAPKASLIPLRVFGCTGSGSTSDVVAALDWAVGHHPAGQPAVMNLSLGTSSSSIVTSVDAATADGIVVVAAAGNSGVDACSTYPAAAASAIAVGATTSSDSRASWSNFGPCLDLFAPGESIRSAAHTGTTSVATMSGTSMAAPHVAGAAALLLNGNPSLTTSSARAALVSAATAGVVTSAGTGSPNALLFADPLAGSTAPVATAPSAAQSVTLEVSGVGALTTRWAAPSSDGGSPITSYTVTLRNASTGAAVGSTSVSSTTRAVPFTGLTVGTAYRASIVAVNAVGASPVATSASVTAATTPSAVRNVKVSYPASLTTQLSWSAPSSTGGSAILRYEFRHTTSSDTSSWTAWTSTGTNRSATISGIPRGATRYAQIRAVTAAGAGTVTQVTIKPTV
jgi:subtilisin family serine protease